MEWQVNPLPVLNLHGRVNSCCPYTVCDAAQAFAMQQHMQLGQHTPVVTACHRLLASVSIVHQHAHGDSLLPWDSSTTE